MRVLLLGAAGFAGRHVAGALLAAGHQVVGVVRDAAAFRRRFPAADAIGADLARMVDAAQWRPHLAGIDAVVNLAGVLRGRGLWPVHRDMPRALIAACEARGVRRHILVSAISAEPDAGTDYARSKLAGEDLLRASTLDWIVLRPSLLYAEAAYGGTALLRGLAAFPAVIPVPGKGHQPFQPLHLDDLARTLLVLLHDPTRRCETLAPVGPELVTLVDLLRRTRAWLGLRPAPTLFLPRWLTEGAAWIGERLPNGPVSTTAMRQLDHGNSGDAAAFARAIGFRPRSLAEAQAARPAQVETLWHARLYLLRPVLRLVLVLTWLLSGLVGLLQPPAVTHAVGAALGLGPDLAAALGLGCSLLDVALGLALLLRPRWRWLPVAQCLVVGGYTLMLGLALPALWLEPFGGLLKNLAVLSLILVVAALAEDR
jgi:uncharacterized protein YbjT (DUF2867 family)